MVKKKVSLGKLEVNFTNRSVYTLITLFGIMIFSIGVFALSAGETPNPGHSIQSIGSPSSCNDGQFLKWEAPLGYDGRWVCSSVSSSGSGGSTGDSFAYDYWFSDSGIRFWESQDMNILVNKRAGAGPGRSLFIQAGGANGGVPSPSSDGGELRLSSGSAFREGSSFISLYTAPLGSSQPRDSIPFERVRVTGSGNVGIGLTNPQAKLHVAGSGTITDNLGIGTTDPQAKLDVNAGTATLGKAIQGSATGPGGVGGIFTGRPNAVRLESLSDDGSTSAVVDLYVRAGGICDQYGGGESVLVTKSSKGVALCVRFYDPEVSFIEPAPTPEPAPTTSWQTVSVGSIGNYDESCRDWITRNNQLGTQRRVLDRGVNAVGYFGAAGAVYENECVYMRESGEISKHHEEFRSNLFRPIDFSREDAHFVETQSLR